MKKLIPILLLLGACNNAAETGKEAAPVAAVTEKSAKGSGTGCAQLIFFRQGVTIEATSYNATGEETSKQETTVLDISEKEGSTVARVKGVDTQTGSEAKTEVEYSYRCDGKNIYMDIASAFRTMQKNNDASFTSTEIEYPIDIREGQTLPDVGGEMSAERNGKKSTMTFQYKNRKVGKRESVTTPAGTWTCYPVTQEVSMEMEIPGMNEKMKEMMKAMQENMKTSTTTWFAPDFGIVKMEMYENGKLKSRNEVTKISKN